jgi:hypothetical protein
MSKTKNDIAKEFIQAGNDIAGLAADVGIPGIGLVTKITEIFYEKHLSKRFENFIKNSEIDIDIISKIQNDDDHMNRLYAVLETVRQTHSKIGLTALALIYRDHWNNEDYIIGALQSFSQISDKVINAFMVIYDAIPPEQDFLDLLNYSIDGTEFNDLYNEAVELIRRNFFVMSTGPGGVYMNGPIQGMKWKHTASYYEYCKSAIRLCV